LSVSWSRPMYHANAINVIAEIRLDKSLLNVDIDSRSIILRQLHKTIQVSYVLPKKYGNKWVRFGQREPSFAGEIMVSFIFNPISLKVENAVILKGDSEKATQLINWIRELNLSENMFYWPGMPHAARTYF